MMWKLDLQKKVTLAAINQDFPAESRAPLRAIVL